MGEAPRDRPEYGGRNRKRCQRPDNDTRTATRKEARHEEELYRGNLRLDEGIIPDDPAYQDLTQQIIDIMDALKEQLPAEHYEQLENLLDLQCQTIAMEAAMAFRCGFKLGAAILLEVVSGKEGFIRGGGD